MARHTCLSTPTPHACIGTPSPPHIACSSTPSPCLPLWVAARRCLFLLRSNPYPFAFLPPPVQILVNGERSNKASRKRIGFVLQVRRGACGAGPLCFLQHRSVAAAVGVWPVDPSPGSAGAAPVSCASAAGPCPSAPVFCTSAAGPCGSQPGSSLA